MKQNPKLEPCFIGFNNVPPERSEGDIRKVFGPYGKILSVKFFTNRITGDRLDVCHVEFSSKEEALEAYLSLDGDDLGGGPIQIRFHHFGMQDGADRGMLGSFTGNRTKHF